jgi:tetratricopeptide (TPR) repeat protein
MKALSLPFALLGVLVAATGAIAIEDQGRRPSAVREALELYAAGEHQAAVNSLDPASFTVVEFLKHLDEWLVLEDRPADRRSAVAAAFALEVAWASTRTVFHRLGTLRDLGKSEPPPSTPLPQGQRYVAVWVARILYSRPAPETLDRTLWLTTVAIAQDAQAWNLLVSEILPRARKRWGSEPRFRLAEVVSRTNARLWPLRGDNSSKGSIDTGFRDADVLRADRLSVAAAPDIPLAEQEFEPLLRDASLAGEASLRIGYLRLHGRDWHGALRQLESAKVLLSEPTLIASAHYLAGWVNEQLGQQRQAVAEYRQALVFTPNMRMLSTRLAALLFLNNEREEAYAVIDRALKADPSPADLLVVIERGDARFVPDWLVSIREALR